MGTRPRFGRKRLGKNKFQMSWTVGYDRDGRQVRKYETFTGSSRDADRYGNKVADRYERNPGAARGITFADFAKNRYLPYIEGLERAPKTVDGYRSKIENHLIPEFGDRLLDEVSPYDVDMFLIRLKNDAKVSEQSRVHIYRVLNQVMNQAVAWELIDRHHCKRPQAPTPPEREFTLPDEAGVRAILKAFEGHWCEPAVILGLHGFRRSEVCGVDWPRVTLRPTTVMLSDGSEVDVAGTVAITGGRHRVTGEGIVMRGTKTTKSERVVALTSWGTAALKRHRKLGGPLLQRSDGRPVDPSIVTRAYRERMVEAKVTPFVYLKDLRHTFGTIATERGVPLWMIADAMGHSTQRTTERFYVRTRRKGNPGSAMAARELENLGG